MATEAILKETEEEIKLTEEQEKEFANGKGE